MGEKNSSHLVGFISRKFLFFLFTVTSFFFVFSWFFVFRSTTGQPQIIDHNLLPNSNLFSMMENSEDSQILVQNENADDKQDAPRENSLVKCESRVPLKVFMYDLPPEFHFELLGWKAEGGSVWPDIQTKIPGYPGGLNLQHSIEYWLTLDILLSTFRDPNGVYSAVRVLNSSEADVVFVPFFSSISYNRHSKVKKPQKKSQNTLLQEKLVNYLTSQEEWKKSGGRNHIVMAHHPNSMLDARSKLWPAMFILSDFGRYPPNVANVEKDVIAPYKHVLRTYGNDTAGFDERPTLIYFQGAIYRKDGGIIRQELYYLLKDEKDVHFSFGSIQKDGIRQATQGMRSSKFCLNIAEALKGKFLIKLLRSIGKEEWTRMWNKLKEIERFFEYQYPSQGDDAVQMIWQAVSRKVPAIRLKIHRAERFARSDVGRDKRPKLLPWSKFFL